MKSEMTKKVAQNGLKHVLVLEFLKSDEIWGGGGGGLTNKHTDRHTDTIVTR